jgi:hypothetical protein
MRKLIVSNRMSRQIVPEVTHRKNMPRVAMVVGGGATLASSLNVEVRPPNSRVAMLSYPTH